jgi:3-dehydro-L-gulonate 2-dehydrogenase
MPDQMLGANRGDLAMTLTLSAEEIRTEVERVILARGVPEEEARLFADIIVENCLDGVTSHGVTRLPVYVGTIDDGSVDPRATPPLEAAHGAIEQWNGNRAIGPIACTRFMARAMELSEAHGIGCVAARNSTHWLRAGTYGRQAAAAGFAAICWTNARPGMPAWGGTRPRLGNNPIVFALLGSPPVVVDIAMSQFSYGRIQEAALAGRPLSVPGAIGFDGNPTTDAAEIIATLKAGAYRLVPTGFWKGSALAFALDALAAVLSGGLASREVETATAGDIGVSQVFIAFDLKRWTTREDLEARLDELREHLRSGHDGFVEDIRAPGEGTARTRARNERDGIPVDETIWQQIRAL